MREVFNWKTQWGMTTESNADVNVLKLGSGYEQRIPKSLNYVSETFNTIVRLHTSRDIEEIKRLKAFLRKHLSYLSFNWTPPLEKNPIIVVCDKFATTNNGPYIDFELTFRQVFEKNAPNTSSDNSIDDVPDLVEILNTTLEQLNG